MLGIIRGDHLQVTTHVLPGLAAHGACRVDVRNIGDIIQTCDVASRKDMQALLSNQKHMTIWPTSNCFFIPFMTGA